MKKLIYIDREKVRWRQQEREIVKVSIHPSIHPSLNQIKHKYITGQTFSKTSLINNPFLHEKSVHIYVFIKPKESHSDFRSENNSQHAALTVINSHNAMLYKFHCKGCKERLIDKVAKCQLLSGFPNHRLQAGDLMIRLSPL